MCAAEAGGSYLDKTEDEDMADRSERNDEDDRDRDQREGILHRSSKCP